jgi:hypothetical protein
MQYMVAFLHPSHSRLFYTPLVKEIIGLIFQSIAHKFNINQAMAHALLSFIEDSKTRDLGN